MSNCYRSSKNSSNDKGALVSEVENARHDWSIEKITHLMSIYIAGIYLLIHLFFKPSSYIFTVFLFFGDVLVLIMYMKNPCSTLKFFKKVEFCRVLLLSKLSKPSKPSKPLVYFLAVLVIKSKPQFFQKNFKTKK